jgi:cyclophilin family peptidyl-prolyl cis-trans isomerase
MRTLLAALLIGGAAFFAGPAPREFRVRLETTKGPIVIEVHRDWAPHGADRFHELVTAGYFDDNRFFRVHAGQWAQFGINGDPAVATRWRGRTIPDDPRTQSNVRGMVAFAFAEPNARTSQIYIALKDLSDPQDAQGFAPFGRVIEGMAVADALNSEYGETPAAASAPASSSRCSTAATHISTASFRGSIDSFARW